MIFRKGVFWVHLCAGLLTGTVILMMAVTGVLLTYERQTIEWLNGDYRSVPPQADAKPLAPEALVQTVVSAEKKFPSAVTWHADPLAPVEASFGRERTLFIDAFGGNVIGEPSPVAKNFFRTVTSVHRWFGAEGENRDVARAVTGFSNLVFLLLVITGAFIWIPRRWRGQHLRSVLLFRRGLAGKARDFNWHNVIGVWSAIPLILIVASGVVMSYPWANRLVYTLTGTEAPDLQRPRQQPAREAVAVSTEGLNVAYARASEQMPGWQTMTVPLSSRGAWVFSISDSHRGRPDRRVQAHIDRKSGGVVKIETFDQLNAGRRLRTWLRWIHTGEAGGVIGQTIAGLVSLGSAVLVWTGFALAFRRWTCWRERKQSREPVEVAVGARD